jgi:polyhydroxyalkanoate synthase
VTPPHGPRPLALHLGAALATSIGSAHAWTLWRSGSLAWRPELAEEARALDGALAGAPPEAFADALARAGRARLAAFLDGVERWRASPHRRDVADPDPVWTEGGGRLLPFGDGTGLPVLAVPSLINRSAVLDLTRTSSLVRFLAASGFDPYLLDWGAPGDVERRFSLTDYVAGRLERAFDAVRARRPDERPAVLGYCMGGTLAAALAERRRGGLSALVLMAAPWDFHADDPEGAARVAAAGAALGPFAAAWGELPVDHIQALFAAIDPALAVRKFVAFAASGPDPEAERAFVALEDWLNDGVPLAAPVALECLGGWYGANEPAAGRWRIAGAPVDPSRIDAPALALIPSRDRIVPPGSARALAAAIPGCAVLEPPLGHIGMVVGRGAGRSVREPLAAFLAEAAAREKRTPVRLDPATRRAQTARRARPTRPRPARRTGAPQEEGQP